MALEDRRDNEAVAILVDDAESSTTAAPTLRSDGIAVHRSKNHRRRCHFQIEKTSASGTRTAQVIVYGYRTRAFDQAAYPGREELTADETKGAWFEIFDTGALSDSGDFSVSYLLEGLADFDRLDTEIVTNGGGGSESITTAFAFAGVER